MKVTHYFPIVVNKINMSLLLPVFLICILYPIYTSQVLDWLLSLREEPKIETNQLPQALIQGDVNVSFEKYHCQSLQV